MVKKILSAATVLVSAIFVLADCASPTSSSHSTSAQSGNTGTVAWTNAAVRATAQGTIGAIFGTGYLTDGGNYFSATTVDSSGHVYAVGRICYDNTYDFGNNVTASAIWSISDAVIVQYNASGTAQWARTVTTMSPSPPASNTAFWVPSNFHAVATDRSGNVYAAGYAYAGFTFGFGDDASGHPVTVAVPGTADSNNPNYPILVKYSSDGTPVWARTVAAGNANGSFDAVATDSSGNIYAAGYSDGDYDFGNGASGTVGGQEQAIVVKFSGDGSPQWAATAASVSGSNLAAIAVDGSGSAYVVGQVYGGSVGFGGTTASCDDDGSANSILVKINAQGTAQWVRTTASSDLESGSSSDVFIGVTIDSSGNVYAAGNIAGTSTYGFGNSISVTGSSSVTRFSSGNNAVIVKYDPSGKALAAATVTGTWSVFTSLTADALGYVYASGSIDRGTYGFGGSVSVTGSGGNAVVVKYRASGLAAQWAKTSTAAQQFGSLTSDGSNLYAADSTLTSPYTGVLVKYQ